MISRINQRAGQNTSDSMPQISNCREPPISQVVSSHPNILTHKFRPLPTSCTQKPSHSRHNRDSCRYLTSESTSQKSSNTPYLKLGTSGQQLAAPLHGRVLSASRTLYKPEPI
ncbi:hypothetical protein HMPREF1544_00464, partial [Mucor circinelloides 1006PhL]